MPPAVEAQSLNCWTTREVPYFKFVSYRQNIVGFLKNLSFFFLAASSLSCSTQDLSLRHMGSFSLWCVGSLLQHSGFPLAVACRFSLSSCGMQAPRCMGSVVCGSAGSLVEARRLSCPAACGILVPQPGMEPASPALEGGLDRKSVV